MRSMAHPSLSAGWSLLALALSCGPAAAQSANRPQAGQTLPRDWDTRNPARGTVQDQAGTAIHGAEVRLAFQPSPRVWRDRLLQDQPLPRVRSGRDGEFFLPLTPQQRRLDRELGGVAVLVVEKPGFHPWIEPLSEGLRGYLGSRVVLRRVQEREVLRVQVEAPPPGSLLRVTQRVGGVVQHRRVLPVPADGELAVPISFLPEPLVLTRGSLSLHIANLVELLAPGRDAHPVTLEYGQTRLRLPAARRDRSFKARFELQAPAAVPPGARVLYRCYSGGQYWFPLTSKSIGGSTRMQPIALAAPGHVAVSLAAATNRAVALQPLPQDAPLELLLHDEQGVQVFEGEARFFPLDLLPRNPTGAAQLSTRARRRFRADGQGRIKILPGDLPGPGFLVIDAPGVQTGLCFDPRGRSGVSRMELRRHRICYELQLRVVDPEGKPLPGATFISTVGQSQLGMSQSRRLRSDGQGLLIVPQVLSRNPQGYLVAPGRARVQVRLRNIKATAGPQRIEVPEAVTFLIRSGTAREQPSPFIPLRISERTQNGQGRISSRSTGYRWTDSEGRILIDQVAAGSSLYVRDDLRKNARQAQTLNPDRKVQWFTSDQTHLAAMAIPEIGALSRLRETLVLGPQSWSSSTVSWDRDARMLVARLPPDLGAAVLQFVAPELGAPVRLVANEVRGGPKVPGRDYHFFDRRKLQRQVRVQLVGPAAGARLRLDPGGMNRFGSRTYLYERPGMELRPDGEEKGIWRTALRDKMRADLQVLHPQFLPAQLSLPAVGEAGQVPRLELKRGHPLSITIHARRKLSATAQVTLQIYTPARQQVVYVRQKLAEVAKQEKGQSWILSLPFALPDEEYQVNLTVSGNGKRLRYEKVKVDAAGELRLELGDAAGDLQNQLQTVQQITAEIQRVRAQLKADEKRLGKKHATVRARQAQLRALEEKAQKVLEQLRNKRGR